MKTHAGENFLLFVSSSPLPLVSHHRLRASDGDT